MVGLAMTSDEAINMAAFRRPDLVLMDFCLAEGNGAETAQVIYSRWAIPSLFTTSYVVHPADVCHVALGCLRKPYSQQDLLQSIEIVEQVMSGHTPTLSIPRNLELYQRNNAPAGSVA